MNIAPGSPEYTVWVVDGDTKYDLSTILIDINLSDQDKQMAQCATVDILNIQHDGKWLTSTLKVRQRLVIYANDGERHEEVFRGFIWTRSYRSNSDDRKITLKCYDQLIYLQESEESTFFADGKDTKDVCETICSNWGIPLEYSYETITHSKLALRGNLADIFDSDILDLVKDRTGTKYVIRSEKDVMKILSVGQNETIYHIKSGESAVLAKSECTMDGMITKVIILGKADDDDRVPVEATVVGKTDQYGTLQKIINRDENTTLDDAKTEANGILKENGDPKWEYEVQSPDIPWIRKGDKVKVSAGDISNRELIVLSVTRNINIKGAKMTLTLEKPV